MIERPLSAAGDPNSAANEQRERQQDCARAGEPQLFADRRKDEVGRGVRDARRGSEGQAGSADTTGAEGVERLDDLKTSILCLGPRVAPDPDAALHMGERSPAGVCANDEHHSTGEEIETPASGQPHHDDEQGEEQQRAAEVLLVKHHEQRHRPCTDQRPDVAKVWNR